MRLREVTITKLFYFNRNWGFSSAGRAPALQAGCQEFDPPNLQIVDICMRM